MSQQGITGLRLAVDEMTAVLTTLSENEWAAPSGCSGWSVKDLVAHIASNYKETVDPSPPPPEPVNLPAEQLMEMLVAPRKDWTAAQVLEEYLSYAKPAIEVLASMQEEPLASTVIPLADLGMYPMHSLADAFAFDGYCHLRVDLLAPMGPISRPVAPATEDHLSATLGWMLAGLPQMQPGLERSLLAPLRLNLTGPGGGSWVLTPGPETITITPDAGNDLASAATVTTDGHAFVIWGTARASWRDHAEVEGDQHVAATFLDALNII
jgi:uncharacterized protein (TIGR03083 family)